ncbi:MULTISPECIES: inorganic phosphate transporter [Brevibacillus]|jgi:PiT family inorganic phosphate transporter|uniref:Anion permease n=1 Tax=Brevibacillus parabrevis TaxID=54914 RepID=A0A4Y3PII8_BREPA|nr:MULTISPECIES: inorganic phosphate transporter [Brevibacillus]MBU8711491.1 inorganic phosphate transporter [Brevibacillus parabrevis]MDH6349880.1 PiT family inorganic phosphate transporter [Brevibacillus sp. 1238]MDR4999334.1 inorganic phosphate transporter [Brevibacillus parabrevis]MED2254105.1 inorganic phosphate transporter [Brevibacillus parabrevis]NRQ53564.1 inorganic phosphate transporter [Brevibacillus sp. HD1.4A]
MLDLSPEVIILVLVVIMALSFDFINGFHDTANAIATSVSTRALSPRTAIVIASLFNLLGALTYTGVAKTIGGKITDPFKLENGLVVVLAALTAAILWNLITWWFGIPSSSSHAIIGGVAGAAVGASGFGSINMEGFIEIVKALIISPIVAFVIGFIVIKIVSALVANTAYHKTNRSFRMLQVLSASWQSFSHGANDAQKTMGVITLALLSGGFLVQEPGEFTIPLWVKLSAALAMALGTSFGGWRIIKTMGGKIMKIKPISGFSADLSSALIITIFTTLKLPVSTTHVITSSILGVGASQKLNAVKWGLAGRIIVTWIITLPVTGLLAAACYVVLDVFL